MTTHVEISAEALEHNVRMFRKLIGQRIFGACVKGHAYGHGLVETAGILLEAGVDWLCVNAVYEASALRKAGIQAPIYILGYVPLEDLEEAVSYDCRFVVYNREIVQALAVLGEKCSKKIPVHIKIETGNNRQGVMPDDILFFAQYVLSFPSLLLEGLTTHFANIEDTADHSYAHFQLGNFQNAVSSLETAGITIPVKHCANTAATILFPETYFDMVRVGLGLYGLWPSPETHVTAQQSHPNFSLLPVMTWKTRIAQIKDIPAYSLVGYGCTYKTTHPTRLAILPIGYYDGYDRKLSNTAYVLIHGKRAPVRGRVCMNITMVDVTDIPEAVLEDEVVLLGRSGQDEISAEQMARWTGTIHYEVTTRVGEHIPRVVIHDKRQHDAIREARPSVRVADRVY